MGGRMAKKRDWEDELASNKRKRKRHRQNRQNKSKSTTEKDQDDAFARNEQDHFLSNLEAKSGALSWMTENR